MKKKILIVEDSPTQAMMARLILEKSGYKVCVAENGRLGLEAALSNPPDLVIADIMMPEMDGYEMTRRIKADNRLCNLPVLMFTTKDQPVDIVMGLDAGADNFLNKPYEPALLLDCVEKLLKRAEEDARGELHERKEVETLKSGIKITKDRMQILAKLFEATSKMTSCQIMTLLIALPVDESSLFVLSGSSLPQDLLSELKEITAGFLQRINPDLPTEFDFRMVEVPALKADTGKDQTGELRSFMHVPLMLEKKPSGLMSLFSFHPDAFDQDTLRYLFEMGRETAEAILRIRGERSRHA